MLQLNNSNAAILGSSAAHANGNVALSYMIRQLVTNKWGYEAVGTRTKAPHGVTYTHERISRHILLEAERTWASGRNDVYVESFFKIKCEMFLLDAQKTPL